MNPRLRKGLKIISAAAVFALFSGMFLALSLAPYRRGLQKFQYRPKGFKDLWMPVTVDWTRGEITARGYGAVPLAARTNAYGLITLFINGVPASDPDTGCKLLTPGGEDDDKNGPGSCKDGLAVDSQRKVKDLEKFKDKVSAFIKGGEETGHGEESFQGRTLAWVEVRVPIKGAKSLTNLLFELAPQGGQEDKKGLNYNPLDEQFLLDAVIVDARGQGVMPALSPRIVSEDGTVIYDSSRVDPEAAAQNGFVTYVTQPQGEDKPGNSMLPGSNRAWEIVSARIAAADELVIPGRKLSASNNKDVTVSAAAAQQIAKTDKGKNAVRSGGVVIVVDMAVGGTEGRGNRTLAWIFNHE